MYGSVLFFIYGVVFFGVDFYRKMIICCFFIVFGGCFGYDVDLFFNNYLVFIFFVVGFISRLSIERVFNGCW